MKEGAEVSLSRRSCFRERTFDCFGSVRTSMTAKTFGEIVAPKRTFFGGYLVILGGLAEECAMPEDDELLDGFPTDEQLDNFLLVPSRSCRFSHRCLNVYLTFYKDGHCHTTSNAPAFF